MPQVAEAEMKSAFQYLRKSEYEALLQQAARRHYETEEVLLEEDSDDRRIFLIESGTVRVQQMDMGRIIELVRMGPGEIFGEMSFIDGERPSASIIACTRVTALAITHHNVLAVVRENPAFYGRFYKSLADILARRLRMTTARAALSRPWTPPPAKVQTVSLLQAVPQVPATRH